MRRGRSTVAPAASVRRAVVVLGMHRSGTSALTGAFAGLGFSLGKRLVPPADDNPGGYFENAVAVDINEELLLQLGRGWDDLREFPDNWLEDGAFSVASMRIRKWLREEFEPGVDIVLKDPRLCLVFDMWRRVLAEEGVDVSVVLATRSASEVVASLQRREEMEADHASLLWLKYMLRAESSSRGLARTVVPYGRFLEDPAHELACCLQSLDFPPAPRSKLRRAVELIDPSKRHHHAPPLELKSGSIAALLVETEAALLDPEVSGELLAGLDNRLGEAVRASANRHAPCFSVVNRCRREARDLLKQLSETQDGLGFAQSLAIERLSELEAIEGALQRVSALAESRLEKLGELDVALASTNQALRSASVLAESRLSDLRVLDEQLRKTNAALAEVTGLANTRLAEVEKLDEQLRKTNAALAEVTGLAKTRLAQVEGLDEQLRNTGRALDAITILAESRLSELQTLDERLRHTDAELDAVSILATARLSSMHDLESLLREARQGLSRAEVLAISRLEELEAFDTRLKESQGALDRAEHLALSRMAEIDLLISRRDELTCRLSEVDSALAERNMEIAAIRRTWSWRMTYPLRWLADSLFRRRK